MKSTITLLFALLLSFALFAQTKKDGTPDMRYRANKQAYGNTYSTPKPKKERNYTNGGQYRIQKGYTKKNGTYVAPHTKTTPDNKKWNNKNR